METEGRRKLPFDSYGGSMRKLDFYTIDLAYVSYLKQAELAKRGFSRVPNMEYGKECKQKFLVTVQNQPLTFLPKESTIFAISKEPEPRCLSRADFHSELAHLFNLSIQHLV